VVAVKCDPETDRYEIEGYEVLEKTAGHPGPPPGYSCRAVGWRSGVKIVRIDP